MPRYYLREASSFVAALLALSCPSYSQNGDKNAVGAAPEIRLPYIADAVVFPKSANEQAITIYKDASDSRERRFFKPVFIPAWEDFEKEVKVTCGGAKETDVKTAPIKVQFASKRLNEEVASELSKSNAAVNVNTIFSYPIYALFVVSGSVDPEDTVATKIQFRFPPGITDVLPQGVTATIDAPLTGLGQRPPLRIRETCANLKEIAVNRDLNAFVYTQYAEVKLNSVSAVISAFANGGGLADLKRDEQQGGVVRVESKSGSKGIGFNLGGFLGGGATTGKSSETSSDTRYRGVSASLIQTIAEEVATDGTISARIEDPDRFDQAKIVETLMTFILGQQTAFKARFEKVGADQWAIVTDTYKRTLSVAESNLLMSSVPDADLAISGSDTVDCAMLAASATGGAAAAGTAGASATKTAKATETGKVDDKERCTSSRNLTYGYADSIKWHRVGPDWVPVDVDIYAIDTQSLADRAKVSIEMAVVTQSKTAQMHTLVHVADIQPTDYLVDQMDQRVSALVAKIDGPAKSVVPITGGLYQTTAYWAGGAYSNVFPCVNTPTSPGDTYEKIGAQEVGTYDGRVYPAGSEGWNLSLGCKGGPEYCDAGGDEFCVSSHRAAGCYVNSEWATWYRARVAAQGAQPKVEEFCAPPL